MNHTSESRLLRLTDGRPRLDGQAVSFRIERHDHASLDVWCPTEEIADIIQYLCEIAAAASEQPGSPPSHPTSSHYLVPLPALGMAFAAGSTPQTTNLVVQLPGLVLSFAMESSGLLALADEMSRIARTLSAGTGKPQ